MRQFVQSKGHRYIGTDLSKTRVSEDLQRYGGPDLLCDAHFLPFADQSVDLVYSAALTEHLACPYLVAQDVARVLKPGGFYLGNVSFLEPWHDDSFFHMSPLGVFELLTQADFDILHIWPGLGYSGFRAILSMGNKVTMPLTFLGDGLYFIYRCGNRIRNLARRREGWRTDSIADAARVSGATDWIARRRL
jgi:SAM-dependent methyltransferase